MGRRWGQHFLTSHSVLEKITAEAAIQPGEPVLEIGPGRGALTTLLLARGARLTAIEVDPALCRGLQRKWGEDPAFQLVPGDVLKLESGVFQIGRAHV